MEWHFSELYFSLKELLNILDFLFLSDWFFFYVTVSEIHMMQ